jgi:hypothetical protein
VLEPGCGTKAGVTSSWRSPGGADHHAQGADADMQVDAAAPQGSKGMDISFGPNMDNVLTHSRPCLPMTEVSFSLLFVIGMLCLCYTFLLLPCNLMLIFSHCLCHCRIHLAHNHAYRDLHEGRRGGVTQTCYRQQTKAIKQVCIHGMQEQ